MKTLQEIARRWRHAQIALQNLDDELEKYAPSMIEDSDEKKLMSLSRECYALKMAYIKRAAALGYTGDPESIIAANLK